MSRDITEKTFLLFVSPALDVQDLTLSSFMHVNFTKEGLIYENVNLTSATQVTMIMCQGNEPPSVDQSVILVISRVIDVDCMHRSMC